jgi:hypothetical protein
MDYRAARSNLMLFMVHKAHPSFEDEIAKLRREIGIIDSMTHGEQQIERYHKLEWIAVAGLLESPKEAAQRLGKSRG